MPQITKRGKFIFGWSVINRGLVVLPPQAVREYGLNDHENLILITGSKATGGFVVARQTVLAASSLAPLFAAQPELAHGTLPAGKFVRYKGRGYAWTRLHAGQRLQLSAEAQSYLGLQDGDRLLCIRGSNLGFVCGLHGPLIDRAQSHPEIEVFD
jgi:hypothetical protein